MSTTLLNGNANLTPSEAYGEATRSLVYRLSELTFGSLLAAYSLGFVGALAAHESELSAHGLSGVVLLSAQYASISITFAYLTTSFYLTYHAGILTMPQMPLFHLRVDFTLAIVQAVFFGFSMLRPWSFPILLGINFLLSIQRQSREFKELAKYLHNRICPQSRRPDPENFRTCLKKLLRKDFSELSVWGPIRWWIRAWAVLIIIIGLAIGYLAVELPRDLPFRELSTNWNQKEILITTEVLFVTIVTTIYGWVVLKRRADSLLTPIKKADEHVEEVAGVANNRDGSRRQKERLKIDEQFDCLLKELAELCTG